MTLQAWFIVLIICFFGLMFVTAYQEQTIKKLKRKNKELEKELKQQTATSYPG